MFAGISTQERPCISNLLDLGRRTQHRTQHRSLAIMVCQYSLRVSTEKLTRHPPQATNPTSLLRRRLDNERWSVLMSANKQHRGSELTNIEGPRTAMKGRGCISRTTTWAPMMVRANGHEKTHPFPCCSCMSPLYDANDSPGSCSYDILARPPCPTSASREYDTGENLWLSKWGMEMSRGDSKWTSSSSSRGETLIVLQNSRWQTCSYESRATREELKNVWRTTRMSRTFADSSTHSKATTTKQQPHGIEPHSDPYTADDVQ